MSAKVQVSFYLSRLSLCLPGGWPSSSRSPFVPSFDVAAVVVPSSFCSCSVPFHDGQKRKVNHVKHCPVIKKVNKLNGREIVWTPTFETRLFFYETFLGEKRTRAFCRSIEFFSKKFMGRTAFLRGNFVGQLFSSWENNHFIFHFAWIGERGMFCDAPLEGGNVFKAKLRRHVASLKQMPRLIEK